MVYLLAFCVPLIYVFLRVVQQRNVAHGEIKWMVVTSYLITAFEIINISIVVDRGWELFLPLGTGGAIGSILAIKLHKRLQRC